MIQVTILCKKQESSSFFPPISDSSSGLEDLNINAVGLESRVQVIISHKQHKMFLSQGHWITIQSGS
jgi:hypothetical protein